jgi:flagellar motor protein MotB
MSREKLASPREEKGESAPLWMISFADMISLLMAFFVMLLTMSTEKSGKLCNENEGVFEQTVHGFRRSLNGFGLSGLFGAMEEKTDFRNVKVYYATRDGDDPGARRANAAEEERMRRLFAKVEEQTRTYEPQLSGRNPKFFVVPVTFPRGQSTLNLFSARALKAFANDLANSSQMKGLNVYFVGLAPDEPSERQRWILSARRAHVAADYVRSSFPSGMDCRVFSWGAASGGDWVKQNGEIAVQSHIAVAIVKPDS